VAELRYGTRPEIEKQLAAARAKLEETHAGGVRLQDPDWPRTLGGQRQQGELAFSFFGSTIYIGMLLARQLSIGGLDLAGGR